jgi:hypothetical protein
MLVTHNPGELAENFVRLLTEENDDVTTGRVTSKKLGKILVTEIGDGFFEVGLRLIGLDVFRIEIDK